MSKRLLIIDDEADIRELIELALLRMGHTIDTAKSVSNAHQQLKQHRYDLCLTDMRLPDGDGLELIEFLQTNHPNTKVAMITAHGDMHTAIRAMKAGAFDFINKPIDITHLRTLVSDALAESDINPTPTTQVSKAHSNQNPYELIGESAPMQTLKTLIGKVAKSQAPVYILGESGTGKELVARNIHQQSSRASGEFVAVNCSAIPSELMESEFFGHIKGSFTGAHQDKKGLFEQAEGGTLFLDEVADLALPMQAKLLRAIQERKIKPVGAQTERNVNIRLLSASHKPLDALVSDGTFREDLYYRLNVIEINTPPLRERTGDIIDIASVFLQKISQRESLDNPLHLSDAASDSLKGAYFKGNVRELENVLERAAALCSHHTIEVGDLDLKPHDKPNHAQRLKQGNNETALEDAADQAPEPLTSSNGNLEASLQASEREKIEAALDKTRWNKTEAAKLLGLTFRQLRYRIQKLDIK